MSKSHLSKRVQSMRESATIAVSQLAREMRAEGKDIISLSIGEPDFNTPDNIKEAAVEALENNFTKYPPIAGFVDLKEEICRKFAKDNNLHFQPSQIVVSTGAKQSIINTILALVDEGDEVILFSPYWVSYIEQVRFAGGTPVIVESSFESDFKVTANKLKNAITSKSKLVIFSSPCNPSGSVYTENELVELAEVISGHEQLYVLSDEIYEHINFTEKHFSIGSIDAIKEKTITVNGVAKGYAMTGWRIGYIGAPQWIAAACAKIQGQFTSGANSIAQKATIKALQSGTTHSKIMKEAFLERRNLVVKLLNEIDGVNCHTPQGAFYVFPEISSFFGKRHEDTTINSAEDLCLYLLREKHVACVGGTSFGNGNCIRLSYAANESTLIEACRRIKEGLDQLL